MSLPSSAPEPGLGEDSAEADGDGAKRARRRRSEEAGGPTAETAPPGGGGETQVPQRRGAHHPAAAVSSTTHYKPLSNTNISIFKPRYCAELYDKGTVVPKNFSGSYF